MNSHNILLKLHLSKTNTSVSALLMFHETGGENPKKAFRLLRSVIYIMIKNYVCIDYLACESKILSQISVGSKHGEKNSIEYWVLEFQIC